MQIGYCVECGGQAEPGTNKCPEHLVGIGRTPNWHNPKRTVIIWVIVVSCVALIGYYGWLRPSAVPVTAEEYAAVICNLDKFPSDATWGDARRTLRYRVREYKKLAPPAEFSGFHEGQIASYEGMVRAMKGKDGGAPMNPYELILDPTAHAAASAGERGERSLSSENYRLLRRHGCRF